MQSICYHIASTVRTGQNSTMAAITIRNLPAGVVMRLKEAARRNGRSMEQEVRELLKTRYAERSEVISRIMDRWVSLPPVSSRELHDWKKQGRK